MAWTIEDNEVSGGEHLTDREHSFPLTQENLETLKSGNKAAVKKLIDEKRGTVGSAPIEEDLAAVRRAAGGDPFQSNPSFERT